MTTVFNVVVFCVAVFLGLVKGVDLGGAVFACSLLMVSFAEMVQGLLSREKSMSIGALVGLAAGFATVFCIYVGISLYSDWCLVMLSVVSLAIIGIPAYVITRRKSQSK